MGLSTVAHAAMLVVLGVWWNLPAERPAAEVLVSQWNAPPEDAPLEHSTPIDAADVLDAGGAVLQSLTFAFEPTSTAAHALLAPAATPIDLAAAGPSLPLDRLNEDVGAPQAGPDQAGAGDGTGKGRGKGAGGQFFGQSVPGSRFVFVVDCSRSMNHPHYSDVASTRMSRVKVELIRSVARLTPKQQFFIVFFNNQAVPMPSNVLQPATEPAKQKFLKWVAEIPAHGQPTDPRQALMLAMQLQPDVIYFLTDGQFDRQIQRELVRYRQNRVTIHTFAFGEPDSETVLRQVAENNGGKYHFIP